MTSIFKLALMATLWLLLTGTLLLTAVPKVLILDRIISGTGLFLVAGEVREGLLGLELKNVRILRGGDEVVRFDRVNLGISSSGILLKGFCDGGRADLVVGIRRRLTIEIRRFPCVRKVALIDGKLTLGEGLRGVLTAEGVKVDGITLERLDLRFEGERFRGMVLSSGVELKGKGRLMVNPGDIAGSRVEGTFRGGGITLLVRGELRKLSVLLR